MIGKSVEWFPERSCSIKKLIAKAISLDPLAIGRELICASGRAL
jgi:hypothetical protein